MYIYSTIDLVFSIVSLKMTVLVCDKSFQTVSKAQYQSNGHLFIYYSNFFTNYGFYDFLRLIFKTSLDVYKSPLLNMLQRKKIVKSKFPNVIAEQYPSTIE